jgi:protein ImuA
VWASGFAALDAALPGGGWPAQALTELLLPHPGVGELRLLAPALAAQQARERSVLWFDPPAEPSAWALEALGIRTRWLVVVRARTPFAGREGGRQGGRGGVHASAPSGLPPGARPGAHPGTRPNPAWSRLPAADILWALEQALASGHAGAVLAWLPARLPADALRRLQLAAQAHEGPAFLLRELEARARPSVAPLRLALASAGPDVLRVHLLKRRGPPLAQPVELALPPVLAPTRPRGRAAVPLQVDVIGAGFDRPTLPEAAP